VPRELIRQWASNATASSAYTDEGWSAEQATGAPNTEECGDYNTAWASLDGNSIDWLEVGFTEAVIATEINIHETNLPEAIVKVEIIDVNGNYIEVYTQEPFLDTTCPKILSISLEGNEAMVKVVRIYIDQSTLEDIYWNEIDAVELVGYLVK